MKTLTILVFAFSFFISVEDSGMKALLQKVTIALSENRCEQAAGYFRQAVYADTEAAEFYYWQTFSGEIKNCSSLALELALYFKKHNNYDKASVFYRELIRFYPDDTRFLSGMAETEMWRGEEKRAVEIYEKVLQLDTDHLQANIFVANYYFYLAEKEKNRIDQEFNRISSPSRSQIAGYRSTVAELLEERYMRAKSFLERVLILFPSSEARKSLEKIYRLEKEFLQDK